MQILIAVLSCRRDQERGCHKAIQETWASSLPNNVDLKFFLGAGCLPRNVGEILCACRDDYESLPEKTRHMQKWATAMQYDYVFKVDVDTYVHPERLVASDFDLYHYSGWFNHQPPGITKDGYASGGSGYWTSTRASLLIAGFDPLHASEDRSVGRILRRAGIQGFNDLRYRRKGPLGEDGITSHLHRYQTERPFAGTGQYDPEWMYAFHRAIYSRGEGK